MRKFLAIACLFGAGLASAAVEASQQKITREAGHELRMLPYYGVFDVINFSVRNSEVTLSGSVTRPTLKDAAEKAVKSIEGVKTVHNSIEVLPLSSSDDAVRMDIYRAIYGNPALSRYGLNAFLPIHIIVKNGDVELIGAVSTELDRNLAGAQANTVGGAHSVHNNLVISKD